MDEFSLLAPPEEALECRALAAGFALTLTARDMEELEAGRAEALSASGRVELGGGILPALIRVFGPSPYMRNDNCAQLLGELQELFYRFKTEARERLGDEGLLYAMERIFDGPAQGSVEYLSCAEAGLLAALAREAGL